MHIYCTSGQWNIFLYNENQIQVKMYFCCNKYIMPQNAVD